MKKIALGLALMLTVASVPGYCVTETVHGFIDRRTQSDIEPVKDTAKLIGLVDKTADKGLEVMDPVLKQRKHITDPVMKGTKFIINGTYGMLRKLFPPYDKK